MPDQFISPYSPMRYTPGTLDLNKEFNQYLFMTRTQCVMYQGKDFAHAIQNYLWHVEENMPRLSEFINCLRNQEYPQDIGLVINAVNDFIRNDNDTILYFIDLSQGVVYKNDREYSFKPLCSVYKDLRKTIN